MQNDFTIRRSLAHVLTLILFLVAGISEAKADQHLSDEQEDKMVFCHLSDDGKTAVISPLVDPRIEWPVDQEFSFSGFNLVATQELCENALAILKDPERSQATDQGYRVVHVAMDQYEPEIPSRFNSRMDDEEDLLYPVFK